MLDKLLDLKEVAQRADVERSDVFQAMVRAAIDALGLRRLSGEIGVAPGLLSKRYASGESAPHPVMRPLVRKGIIDAVNARIAAGDLSERTAEDVSFENDDIRGRCESTSWGGRSVYEGPDAAKDAAVRAQAVSMMAMAADARWAWTDRELARPTADLFFEDKFDKEGGAT